MVARFGVLVLSLVAGLLVGVPPVAAAAEPSRPEGDRPVPVGSAATSLPPLPGMPTSVGKPPVWPQAASAVVDLPALPGSPLGRGPAAASVGGLPVRVTPLLSLDGDAVSESALSAAAAQAPSAVLVEVLDRGLTTTAGYPLAVRVSRADGGSGPARVRLDVDYSGFRSAFGGGWSDRLGLKMVSRCALVAHVADSCPAPVPLASANNAVSGVVSAEVSLTASDSSSVPPSSFKQAETRAEAAPAAAGVLVVLAAGQTGEGGDFTRTDLKETGSWAVGGSSGEFTYSLPLAVPPVASGLAPQVALSYSSGGVDGQTSTGNTQPSVIGEGWSYHPGFIERTLRPCKEDQDAAHPPHWTHNDARPLGPCWRYDNYQLSWGGRSGELVPTATPNVFKLESDDATRVEKLMGGPTGAIWGEHFKLTTTDGTQYWFGKTRLPGWVSGRPETNSVLTQAVWANHSDDVCFSSSRFYDSRCDGVTYRWQLDYVVDARGNSMGFYYGRDWSAAGIIEPVSGARASHGYYRASHLTRIEYGHRAGSEATANAPAVVEFEMADRCVTSSCGTHDAANYPDTPWDLQCDGGDCANNMGPSYWTHRRLSKVVTKVHAGGGVYKPVDKYELAHSFPGGTSRPVLWLDSVTRTGYDANDVGTTMLPVKFHGQINNNRADYDPNGGMADHMKYRIDHVDTETGGRIAVAYLPMDAGCQFGQAAWPDPESNAHRCYPQQYTNSLGVTGWSWWHKFVVDKVTLIDGTGGSPPVTTSYSYSTEGSTNKALWAYTGSVWGTKDKANSRWVGYPTVSTTVGVDSGQQSQTKTVYYRGLDGDLTDVYFGTEHYGQGISQVALADVDGDGLQDLITDVGPSHQLWAYRNQGYGKAETFVSWDRRLLTSGFGPIGGIELADVDGDDRADLIWVHQSTIHVYRNQGWAAAAVFTSADQRPLVSGVGTLDTNTFADVDGDGLADLVTNVSNDIWVHRNQGYGQATMFSGADSRLLVGGWGSLAGVEVADMDGDGRADLIDDLGSNPDIWVYQSRPWSAGSPLVTGPTKRVTTGGFGGLGQVSFADMTGDGRGDLVADSGPWRDLWIYKNQGLTATDVFVGWERQRVATTNPMDEGNNIRRSVQVLDSSGAAVADHPALGGQVRETQTLDGPAGAVLAKTITNRLVWERAGGALPAWQTPAWRYSYLNREQGVSTWTRIADGSYRQTYVGYTYDNYGTLTSTDDQGQVGLATDDMCTRHEHVGVDDGSRYMVGFVKRTVTTAGNCASTPVYPADGISEIRYSYDGQAYGVVPGAGLVTKTETASSYTGSTPNWTWAHYSYDERGQIRFAKDALEQLTETVYTYTAGGRLATTAVKSPLVGGLQHVATTEVEPKRGQPIRATDANGKTTNAAYDAVGRLVKVWRPGHPITGTPDVEYRYVLSATTPSYIETKVLGPNGNQISSFDILDSLLRPRQTQTVTEVGHRMVTDTRYNNRGLADKASVFYSASGGPNHELVWPTNQDAGIPRQTRYVYDKPGRTIKDQLWSYNALQSETTTAHEGDRTGVIPPQGGTVTQDIVDARGRVVEKRQYQSPSSLTGSFSRATYGYNRQGNLTSVTDPANNSWTYAYDLLGRKTQTVDPDAGTTTTNYNVASQIRSTKDGRDQWLFYEYDALGRKTKQRDGSATGPVMAEWAYDTVAKGQLAASTRYVGADAYRTRITSLDDGYRPLHVEVDIPNAGVNGGLAGTYAWDYTYKPNGAPATTVQPAVGGLPAETLTHIYSNTGFAQTLTGTWTGGSQTYLADIVYHYDGLPFQRLMGDPGKQVRIDDHYDQATRRPDITWVSRETSPGTFTTKYETDYAHDPAGNIVYVAGKTDGQPDQTECFRHDHLRRLTEAWTQASLGTGCTTPQRAGQDPYWRQWTFDAIGNRLTQTDKNSGGDTTWTYQVGAAGAVKPHQLKQVTSTGPLAGPTRTYSYDNAGNTLTATTSTGTAQTLTWDKENHLSTVTEGGTTTATYVYDADGRRLLARTPTKTTLYLPDGTELEQASGGGTPLGTRYYAGLAVRQPNGGLKWTITNHQNTAVTQIDAVTLTPTRRRMLPFGEDRTTPPPTWMGTKGFVDGTQDPTGLTHLGAREYDPTLGRFISIDPIMDLTDPQQWHPYTYANNSPVTFSDPSGLVPTCDENGNTTCPTPDPENPGGCTNCWSNPGGGRGNNGSRCTGNSRSASCAPKDRSSDDIVQSGIVLGGELVIADSPAALNAFMDDLQSRFCDAYSGAQGKIGCSPDSWMWRAIFENWALSQICTITSWCGISGAEAQRRFFEAEIQENGFGSLLGRLARLARLGRAPSGGMVVGPIGSVPRSVLEAAAAGGGPTTRVVTNLNLTHGLQTGRGLSVATGESADALARTARAGGTMYTAEIPNELLYHLYRTGLARTITTEMGGVVGTEIRFTPAGVEYVRSFFGGGL